MLPNLYANRFVFDQNLVRIQSEFGQILPKFGINSFKIWLKVKIRPIFDQSWFNFGQIWSNSVKEYLIPSLVLDSGPKF